MKTYTIRGLYTISVEITVKADSLDEAYEIADSCGGCIETEFNGNSVFVEEYNLDEQVKSMTLEADGMLRDLECDDEDSEEDEDEDED